MATIKLLLLAIFATLSLASAGVSVHDILGPRKPVTTSLPRTASLLNNVQSHHILQHIDNFDPSNHNTFEQRYLSNDEFYRPGGPIFIFLSGQHGVSEDVLTGTLMAEMASELYGHLFYLEHRYYGESFPVPDMSDENLRFLTPSQALADIAHFIDFIKAETHGAEDSPVILVGLHYSGSLAVWFRQQYPHLVLASWASSAPLLLMLNQAEYKVNAGGTFRAIGGDSCYNQLEAGFLEMERKVAAGEFEELSTKFQLCETLNGERNISGFFSLVSELYAILAQTATVQSVTAVCNVIQFAPDPILGVASIIDFFFGGNCVHIDYAESIALSRETELNSLGVISSQRQASFQQCNHLGFYHTSDADDQPFGSSFPMDIFIQGCEDIFPEIYSNATNQLNIERLNVLHGGLNPEVTNVIFTQGGLDPWRTTGVLEDLNDDAVAIFINNAPQGSDINAIRDNDTQAVLDAKLRIKSLIRYWIARDAGVEVVPI